jgi:hypothetical protein
MVPIGAVADRRDFQLHSRITTLELNLPIQGTCMSLDFAAGFPHRRNVDGTYDSVCPTCFLILARNLSEPELVKVEGSHECPGAPLSPPCRLAKNSDS